MTLKHLLGPAVSSVMTAIALLGPGSAEAAAHEQVGLCKAQELILCAAGNLIPVGSGQLLGKATNPVIESAFGEKCPSSLIKVKVTGVLDETARLKSQIDSLTFSECEPCKKITVNNLPLAGELSMGTLLGDDWTFTWKGNMNMTECAFGQTCKFGSEKFTSLVEMTESGSVLNTNKAEMKFEGGNEFFCGKTLKLNAKYALLWALTTGGEDLVFPTLLGLGPHERYGLCTLQELLLCKEGNRIKVDSGQLLGKAINPVLEGTLAEKCASSLAKGTVTGKLDEVGRLKGQIDSLTFTTCEPCKKVTVNNLPLAAEIAMNTTLGSDWRFTSQGDADLTECAFGLTCKFGSEKVLSLIEYNKEGTGTILNTNKAELKFQGGSEFFCGKTGKWNAKYALTWTLLNEKQEPIGEHAVFPTLLSTA